MGVENYKFGEYKVEIEWARKASFGMLLKKFWEELDLRSKREFFFSLCELTGDNPGQGQNDLFIASDEARGLYRFLRDLLDLSDWRMQSKLLARKPKLPSYFDFLHDREIGKFNQKNL
ncbi:MAG: hypothetical protein NTY64_15655 [Deltaproteobacteria bacterium]|nr:hypothetical protein [Deltaproteobacteria bacterium]